MLYDISCSLYCLLNPNRLFRFLVTTSEYLLIYINLVFRPKFKSPSIHSNKHDVDVTCQDVDRLEHTCPQEQYSNSCNNNGLRQVTTMDLTLTTTMG